MVASIPTLAPVGTTPNPCGRLGSSGFARAPDTIITSLSPCTRVAIAHSTSVGSNTSISSSTTTTCLRSMTESAASSAFLPSPGCFLIEITACQNAQPPSVTLMSLTCTPAVRSAWRRAIARACDLDRMSADADRDRQRTPTLVGPLREQSHVVRCDDVDAGETFFLHDEAVDAAVDAELGVARDHDPGGDHRTAVE